MSQILIQQYLNQLQDLRKVSGTHRESVVREAFKDLLKGWARSHDLVFVPEYEIETKAKDRRYVDGALLYELRMPFGYWEAKDEKDNLDAEIETKFRRGYRPRPGTTSSATARRWNGYSTSTRKRNPRTRPSATSSTPTASPTTK